MSFDFIYNINTQEVTSPIVERNFLEGDLVNASFEGSFYRGKVVERIIEDGEPYALVKTEKQVGFDKGDYLNGFGLKCPFDSVRTPLYFADEPLPNGSEIYQKWITRPMTKEEWDEANEPLPF